MFAEAKKCRQLAPSKVLEIFGAMAHDTAVKRLIDTYNVLYPNYKLTSEKNLGALENAINGKKGDEPTRKAILPIAEIEGISDVERKQLVLIVAKVAGTKDPGKEALVQSDVHKWVSEKFGKFGESKPISEFGVFEIIADSSAVSTQILGKRKRTSKQVRFSSNEKDELDR